ncbi:prostatic acid phosphatase-like [Brevipalpus obovatus]|uniref:prostatic acid phosphatase-like n=1 Tax=Brevipalpus obovatus TaxID=246614 RepID=UPI003D9DDD4B
MVIVNGIAHLHNEISLLSSIPSHVSKRIVTFFLLQFILLLYIGDVLVDGSGESELVALAIVHRHGDRTPVNSFPKNIYGNCSYWPDGWGQLTSCGKRRMYEVGKRIRKRYQNFLPHNIRDVLVRSSDADRCLESASLVLAGAFPPKDRWVWESNFHWVPIPIHTTPKPEDGVLNPSSNCPEAQKEWSRIHSSKEFIEAGYPYKDVFEYLTIHTGMNVTDIGTAHLISDVIKIQKENNFTLPWWVTDEIFEKLLKITDLLFHFDYSTPTIQRLRTGLLFEDIKNKFFTAIDSAPISLPDVYLPTSIKPKVFIYSTHDALLSAMLNALGAYNGIAPPYGTTTFFELRKNSHGRHEVSLLYLNSTAEAYPLKMSACGSSSCDLEQFVRYIDKFIPGDWQAECGLRQSSAASLVYSLLSIPLSLIVIFGALFFFYFIISRRKKDKHYDKEYLYQRLTLL